MYYEINETRARQAKDMNSFYAYRPGSATEEYRALVDKAAAIAEAQKMNVGEEYHEKIDALLERYARKLAENMNKSFDIECRCPSVLISGPAKFPVRQKEKQNAARDKNMREWREIQAIINKIKNVGTGGISADDPNALERLRAKLSALEEDQQYMKNENANMRKKGFDAPYAGWQLTNNNANIKRIRECLARLERLAAKPTDGWQFDGGKVVINTEVNRLQILFDAKPDESKRKELKSHGFKWAPSQGAWQRQYTDNAVRDARRVTA